MGLVTVTPWSFRPKGYCRLRLSVYGPSVQASQILAGIKFAPNTHRGIFSNIIENMVHLP